MARRNTAQEQCPSCAAFLPSSGSCARCSSSSSNGSFSPSSDPVAGSSSSSSSSSAAPSAQPSSPSSSRGPASSSSGVGPTIVVEPFSDAPMPAPDELTEQAFGPSLETVQAAFQVTEDQARALLIFAFDMLAMWRGEHWQVKPLEVSGVVPPLTRQINAHERIA